VVIFISRGPGSGMASCAFCLCVCVIFSCNRNIFKSYERILMEFFEGVGLGALTNQLDFIGSSDSFVDPGLFPISR